MDATQIKEILKTKLAATHVDVEDESREHAGHDGAKSGGGHYRVTIVSGAFLSKSALERHRLVYAALEGLMGTDIHALAIRAMAPGEVESR